MTRTKAIFIKVLRVKQGYTWRAVQRELNTRYKLGEPFLSQQFTTRASGNQIEGMDACREAMEFLGETTEQGWN